MAAGEDHTPGDTNGRMMLINAAFAAGSFFSKTFTGLSAGTQYDFSAWITNANNGNPILPNVTFRVVDPVTGTVLGTVSTGDMPRTATLTWNPFNLKFTATQPTVRLELVNNAPGGNGNDLAIDDIALAAVCEHGDAPDSYATLLASNGPVHGRGAPHLGATVDYEGDGRPTAAADGDDLATGDDEDGVTFNPALGYPEPDDPHRHGPGDAAAGAEHRPRQRLGGRLRQRVGGLERGRRLRRRRRARR